ncbi:MAG TPA: peptide chain release factor N(5)-glutamine methyltransferase [Methylibium sp.]|nr:peptide chain release factor N(5)-glutamine methyltransferase [Methylibium sp.]
MSATVGALLEAARRAGLDRLDAQLLLGAVLAQTRAWLIAHDDRAVAAVDAERFHALAARRAAGEPVAYLLGEKEFHGLALRLTPDVLVPRPDTETLVDWALELLPPGSTAAVLDLGTGSGAVALALARQRPTLRLTAVDASPAALAVARGNGERLGLPLRWLASDWFGALAGERYDLVVGNPPYIAEGDPHLAALQHEPVLALSSGPDGLDAIRRIAAAAPAHLVPGAWLLLEHGHDQAEAVRALLAAAGLADARTRPDLAGRPRCSGARRAAA